ncbi:MAG: hypothetical protein ACR2RV_02185 [Verrucomicrobiales bacterium]
MTQFIVLIHGNARSVPSDEEWEEFVATAVASRLFRGGSEIGERSVIGAQELAGASQHIVGFMRFDSADRGAVVALLERHPVVLHGGSVELCEMPRSSEGDDDPL